MFCQISICCNSLRCLANSFVSKMCSAIRKQQAAVSKVKEAIHYSQFFMSTLQHYTPQPLMLFTAFEVTIL